MKRMITRASLALGLLPIGAAAAATGNQETPASPACRTVSPDLPDVKKAVALSA
jgi:hypothetical protein